MTSIPLCLTDSITPEQFLSEYWQKKPLLIKQGLPQLIDMFEPEDMLGLAVEEDASARLLIQAASKHEGLPQWQLKKSPLSEADFDNLPAQWTVLVQNMEQWSPELGQLWQAFDFIPQWQRDDIMVSFAPKGGSVGKHYDDYDVFLAQGYGSRRWQLGKFCDKGTEFVANEPIRLFDDMGEIIFDEILEAGDVLYVPPKLSHFGVAQDDCLTFSFGCRRPNLMQIIDSLADIATSDSDLFIPMLLPQALQASGALQADSIDAIKEQLLQMLQSKRGDDIIRQAVLEVVSKRQYDALVPEETLDTD
ncbi:cupin domain-containing protein, partial [Psychrobacter sp. T6-1]|uniref:cupin domain-containing protein n=1 Tax=Psychrobacter sp. T6-1 TaxID=3457447 RepID=UPI003FD11DD1